MLNTIGQWFTTNAVDMCVYIAIVGLLLFSLIKCVIPVWRTRARLRKAIRSIKNGGKGKHSWQEDGFLGRGALYPHWSEYLDNLFFADGEYHNASNVEDYINEETVISQPGKANIAAAVPGIMVSLGFLGTLIGITRGLAGFSMENSEAVLSAIRTLIPGMKYAFTTSIVGVTCSMLFTLCTGVINGSTRATINDFYAAMHNDANVLAVDPLNQITIYQQEQTAQVTRIAQEVTEKLPQNLAQAMEPLSDTLERFCAYTTQAQTQAMDALVSRFLDRLDESMEGEFRALASSLAQARTGLRETSEVSERMSAELERAMHSAKDLSHANEELLAGFGSYIARLNAAQTRSESMDAQVTGAIQRLEALTKQQSQMMQEFTRTQGALDKEMREIAGNVQLAGESLRASAQTLSESHKAFVGGVNEDLEKTYQAFFDDIGETTKKLSWLVDDVKAALEQLPQTLREAADIYAEQGEQLNEAIRELSDELRRD